MQTYSHVLINAAVALELHDRPRTRPAPGGGTGAGRTAAGGTGGDPAGGAGGDAKSGRGGDAAGGVRHATGLEVRRAPFILGGLLPDVPLVLLTLAYWARTGWPWKAGSPPFGPGYDALYFGDPFWVAATNLLHAPLVLLALILLGRQAGRAGHRWGGVLLWFAAGCLLHTLGDIVTHHGDGPLLFFPFNWAYRFESPISYWERAHHAAIVSSVEHLADLAILGWLGFRGARGLLRRLRTGRGAGPGRSPRQGRTADLP